MFSLSSFTTHSVQKISLQSCDVVRRSAYLTLTYSRFRACSTNLRTSQQCQRSPPSSSLPPTILHSFHFGMKVRLQGYMTTLSSAEDFLIQRLQTDLARTLPRRFWLPKLIYSNNSQVAILGFLGLTVVNTTLDWGFTTTP